MASEEQNRQAFLVQEHNCRIMDAPIYARLCDVIAKRLTRKTRIGARILDWPGGPTRDALPLRFIGGLHALVLARADKGLAAIFDGSIAEEDAIAEALERVLARHDRELQPWLDGPPQTNEPGRSGALMVGLIEVARRHGPKLEILEIGSSAGLNLLIDRFGFDLGGVRYGPADAPVVIAPDWRGPPPPAVPLEIVSTRGCDIAPLDATDPPIASRLCAYIWAEATERLARTERAIAMLGERGVALDRADAADWLEARLVEPLDAGTTRVLMHSVVWQYLPAESQARIRAAMAAAGARATGNRPLAWVIQEPNRETGKMYVRVRSWPGHDDWQALATVHAHGAWIDTSQITDAGIGEALPDVST